MDAVPKRQAKKLWKDKLHDKLLRSGGHEPRGAHLTDELRQKGARKVKSNKLKHRIKIILKMTRMAKT